MATYEERWGGRYPPRGAELRAIERYVRLDGRRVLEVGSGNGRLTFQYASHAARVLAIDPDPTAAREGSALARERGLAHVRFRELRAEALDARVGRFDVALLTWSL